MVTLVDIKEWLVPISTFITLITASVGGWLSLREYRLKLQAEIRLAKSAELEADIKLLKVFTEIMNIAHARGGVQVSEKAIEKMLDPEFLKGLGSPPVNLSELLSAAVIHLPIGEAAQDSAISAIWALGRRHELLGPVAHQALISLGKFKSKVTEPYLRDFAQRNPGGIEPAVG